MKVANRIVAWCAFVTTVLVLLSCQANSLLSSVQDKVREANGPTYTVTYDGNGSTGGTATVDGSSPYQTGATVTVLGQGSLVKTGYAFVEWNTAANGSGTIYAPGATFTISTSNVTLYAQWTNTLGGSITVSTPNYTVTIDGGTALHFTNLATFSSSYSGTATGYQWYMNGVAITGATTSSLSVTPTYGVWQYGTNLITLLVTDADGLVFSGSLAVSVTNP